MNIAVLIFGGLVVALFCFNTCASMSMNSTKEDFNTTANVIHQVVNVAVQFDKNWVDKYNSTDEADEVLYYNFYRAEQYFKKKDEFASKFDFNMNEFKNISEDRFDIESDKYGINIARDIVEFHPVEANIYLFVTARATKELAFPKGIAAGNGTICSASKRDRVILVAGTANQTATHEVIADTIDKLMTKSGQRNTQCLRKCKNTGMSDSYCEKNKRDRCVSRAYKDKCERTCHTCF